MNEKNKIRAFLAQHFGSRELGEQEDIFAAGFVNSLFAMQIILFVEKEFEITIASEDLELANFRTIEAISALVERKRSASPTVA
jgi:acyl carrier protein